MESKDAGDGSGFGVPTRLDGIAEDFDKDYTAKVANAKGRFWKDHYPPELQPYARLVHDRNAQTVEWSKGGEAVLDLGCGMGDLLYIHRDRYGRLYGIDPSRAMADYAQENLERRGLGERTFVSRGVAENIEYPDNTFDTILMLDVIEHVDVEYRLAALREVRRVLKPGGELLLATPSKRILRFWNVFDNILMIRQRRRRSEKCTIWQFQKKPYCEVFLYRRELFRLIREAGLDISRWCRVGFYPAPETPGYPERWLRRFYNRWPRIFRLVSTSFQLMSRLRIFNQKVFLRATKPHE